MQGSQKVCFSIGNTGSLPKIENYDVWKLNPIPKI